MLRRMLVAQCGVTALLALALWLFGPNLLHSALLGAGLGVAGNGYAAWRVFWRPTERVLSGTSELATLYRAEVGKLAIIGGLCAVFFSLSDGLVVSGLVVGLLLSLVVSSLSAILCKTPLALITE